MKDLLTKVFWPILRIFESDRPVVNYKRSHRVVLLVMGSLFLVLSLASASSAYFSGELGGLIPAVVFFGVGLVAIVVGALGSDSAVAKIWGSR